MSGEALPLSVVPNALHSASEVIGGRAAHLASPSTVAQMSTESAGQAGAAVDRAVDAYRAAFAQRLSRVVAGLHGAAGAFTDVDVSNSQALAAISPAG